MRHFAARLLLPNPCRRCHLLLVQTSLAKADTALTHCVMLKVTYSFSLQETLRQRLKLLSEEKSDLQNQLMDCLHRTEQEGKVLVSLVFLSTSLVKWVLTLRLACVCSAVNENSINHTKKIIRFFCCLPFLLLVSSHCSPGLLLRCQTKQTRQEKKNMIPDFVSFKYQAFHKTNDERRAYLSEIAKVSVHFCPRYPDRWIVLILNVTFFTEKKKITPCLNATDVCLFFSVQLWNVINPLAVLGFSCYVMERESLLSKEPRTFSFLLQQHWFSGVEMCVIVTF